MNPNYRSHLTIKVLQQIIEGESVSVISVPGNGKTHWQEHLRKPDVLDYLFGESGLNSAFSSKSVLFVTVDANGLSDMGDELPSSWIGFELILRSLYWALVKSTFDEDIKRSLIELVIDALKKIGNRHTHGPARAFGIVEQTFYRIYNSLPADTGRIVIILEEPELWLSRIKADEFFLNLRYLRDQLRYKLMYMIVARQSVKQIAIDKNRYRPLESFFEIFRNPLILGMYSRDDFVEMLIQLATRKQRSLTADEVDILFWCTGGHGSLTRSCFDHIEEITNARRGEDILSAFLDVPKIADECESLYEGLTEHEQTILKKVLNRSLTLDKVPQADKHTANLLQEKGLLGVDTHGDTVALPLLLSRYIKKNKLT
jgi:hypothetical protein